jgi:hypothetical protein
MTIGAFHDTIGADENALRAAHSSLLLMGGGVAVADEAVRLAKAADSVTLVMPNRGILDSALPPQLSALLVERLRASNVRVHTSCSVQDVRHRVTASTGVDSVPALDVSLSDGSVVRAHYLLQSVEGAPCPSTLANSFELTSDGTAVCVNAEFEARRDHWVAGPLANYHDLWLDARRSVFSPDHDDLSASVAGLNMTGARLPYLVQPYVIVLRLLLFGSVSFTLCFNRYMSWHSPLATIDAVGLCDYERFPTIEYWTIDDGESGVQHSLTKACNAAAGA